MQEFWVDKSKQSSLELEQERVGIRKANGEVLCVSQPTQRQAVQIPIKPQPYFSHTLHFSFGQPVTLLYSIFVLSPGWRSNPYLGCDRFWLRDKIKRQNSVRVLIVSSWKWQFLFHWPKLVTRPSLPSMGMGNTINSLIGKGSKNLEQCTKNLENQHESFSFSILGGYKP